MRLLELVRRRRLGNLRVHAGLCALTARILASLPAFAADRGSNPGTFSFYLTVYAIGALAGAIMILLSLI